MPPWVEYGCVGNRDKIEDCRLKPRVAEWMPAAGIRYATFNGAA